jgi:hypothetical protein
MMLRSLPAPIVRKINSMKNLSPCQRRRLNWLKEVFRKEGRIAPGTSGQEVKYLYRLEAGRRRYRWRKRPSISEQKEWEEARKKADPYSNFSIEEILANLSRKRDEQNEVSEK